MTELEKRIRVLYVCPWAHWGGHYPEAVKKESLALLEAGAEVSICTFRGILDQEEPQIVPHRSVVSSWIGFPLGILTYLLHLIPKGEYLAGLLEQFATLCLAVKLRKILRYDVIYLRDGDPFVCTPFLLGLVLEHYNWAVNLVGQKAVRAPDSLLSSLFCRFINAPIWKPIYLRSFSKNRFAFLCENEYVKEFFEAKFLDGILSGRLTVVSLGVKKTSKYILQREARQYLGLPEDKAVFLHFGVLHQGKDIETVLDAIRDVPDALVVHAGEVRPWANRIQLGKHSDLQGNVIIRNCYIPEAEKQYYFAAADAIILSYKKDSLAGKSILWEAARFKLPAIASDVGDLGELVRRYKIGLVFEAEDVASLRSALFDFLGSSHGQREAMVSNCEHFCDDFSTNTWAGRCIKIFTELCGHTSREK